MTANDIFYPQNLDEASAEQLREAFGVSDWFVYQVDFTGLNFGTSEQVIFTIQSDSDFLWQQATYAADIAAAAYTIDSQPVPNISLQIQDTSAGRYLMTAPVPVPNVFGLGREPFQLKNPRWFRSNSTVVITALNFDAAVEYNLHLSFIGTKFFNYPG